MSDLNISIHKNLIFGINHCRIVTKNNYLLLLGLLAVSGQVFAESSIWYKDNDPLETKVFSLPKLPDGYREPNSPCADIDLSKPLNLADVADASLCNNPQTREVWASARVQAAQLGVAKSAYLPSLNNNVSGNLGVAIPESDTRSNPTVNLSNSLAANYLLYDFGNRAANLENARQLLVSASASQSSTVQNILLQATVAFYQVQANIAALDAAIEAERASQESFKAADARYKAGVSTPADKLQAQTAYAQLTLTRITSEGSLQNAYGNLANVMGLPANQKLSIVVGSSNAPATILEDVNGLVHGASIGGLMTTIVFARWHRISFWKLVDVVAPSLILGQAIGRWGNFFNSEAFGAPTNLPWKLYIPIQQRPPGFESFEYFHPTFLYESLWNLSVLCLLLTLFARATKPNSQIKDGTIFLVYLVTYSIGRFWIEGLRTDSLMLLNLLRIAQVISLAGILVGGMGLIWLYWLKRPLPDVNTTRRSTTEI